MKGAMEHENTNEPIICPICSTDDYNECTHLVASIDLTFSEVEGGAFYDRHDDFVTLIEPAFKKRHSGAIDALFSMLELEDAYQHSEFEQDVASNGIYLHLGSSIIRVYEELLTDAGAVSFGPDLVVNGPPGMSSAYLLLAAEQPDEVVENAYLKLKMELAGAKLH